MKREKLKEQKETTIFLPKIVVSFWLGNRDSNPNKQSQSLSCYRYTIPQYFFDSKSIITTFYRIVKQILKFIDIYIFL